MTPSKQAQPATRPAIVLWLALVIVGVVWGATQLFSKIIVSDGHHPIGITFTATALGAVLITAVAAARGGLPPMSRRHAIFYTVCGSTGTALPNVLGYTAITHLPVGVISIVLCAVPMTTFLVALALGMERTEPKRVMGLVCGAGAVLLLVAPEASLPGVGDAIWVLFALGSGLCYTLENIYIARARPEDCGPLQTLCGLMWAALLLVTPAVVMSGTWMAMGTFDVAEFSLVAMTVLHLIAYGGFVWLIGQAGPVFAAQVGYAVTLSGVFLGIAVLGETHSGWVWLSLGLMLVGLSLVQPKSSNL